MANKEFLQTMNGSYGAMFDKKVDYMLVYDYGVTYGTIFNNISNWIKNDLEDVVKFNTTFISSRLTHDKEFVFPRAMIAEARKPNISFKYNIDHTFKSQMYSHPSVKSYEATKFLADDEFLYPLFAFEDDKDVTNNMTVKMGLKGIKCDVTAGIAVNTRYEADNIVTLWTTKRYEDGVYAVDMLIDFKIPSEVILLIAKNYNIDHTNHHDMLEFLNSNSMYIVSYALDGYDGQHYYFIKYGASVTVTVNALSNPQAFDQSGSLKSETFTFYRTFSFEILIPSLIGISKYGDRLLLEDMKNQIHTEVTPEKTDEAKIFFNDRYVEIERVIDKKHALKQVTFTWTKEDVIEKTTKNGKKIITTNPISISDLIQENQDKIIVDILDWAKTHTNPKTNKPYAKADIFNFVLYESNPTNNLENIEVLKEEVVTINPLDSLNALDDVKGGEYKPYLKNMLDFTIMDLDPKIGITMYGVLYIDLAIYNKYEDDTQASMSNRVTYANDDMGIITATGDKDKNKGYGQSNSNRNTQNTY